MKRSLVSAAAAAETTAFSWSKALPRLATANKALHQHMARTMALREDVRMMLAQEKERTPRIDWETYGRDLPAELVQAYKSAAEGYKPKPYTFEAIQKAVRMTEKAEFIEKAKELEGVIADEVGETTKALSLFDRGKEVKDWQVEDWVAVFPDVRAVYIRKIKYDEHYSIILSPEDAKQRDEDYRRLDAHKAKMEAERARVNAARQI